MDGPSKAPKPAKAKKVGILFFLDAKRRNGVRRFCILTANREIDYFSRDENDPAARVGSIGPLQDCRVVVHANTEADFSVTTGDTTYHLQAQGGDQDRRNWVLEILKQRSIAGIISLLGDAHIGTYAAYALANQCGGADELKVEIVREGGLEPLMRFTSTSQDAGLVGLIYYSLSKLSVMNENKAAVGAHLPMLVELLRGDVAEYKAHALRTLVNLVHEPAIRARMLELGLLLDLVRALHSVHTSVQPEASSVLLTLCTEQPEADQCRNDIRKEGRQLLSEWIETWADLPERDDRLRMYSSAFVNVVRVLESCYGDHRSEATPFVRPVCSVLPISKAECVGAVVSFLRMYLGTEKDMLVPKEMLECAEHLVAASNSTDVAVQKDAILVLSRVLQDERMEDRPDLWRNLNSVAVVDHLRDEEAAVRSAAVQLFAALAAQPGAAASLQRDVSSLTKLGQALLEDASLSSSLTASLASLSTVPEIKYALLTGPLRQGLLASISKTKGGAEVTNRVLEVFTNCTSNQGARRALADEEVLQILIDALESPSPDVQTRLGSVLANLSANSHIRRKLRQMKALKPMFAAIMATKNRHLRLELLGAASNMCHEGEHLPDTYLTYLLGILSSKSLKLRNKSIAVLRNASVDGENCASMLRLEALTPLFDFLADAKDDGKQMALTVVAMCLEKADKPSLAECGGDNAVNMLFKLSQVKLPVRRSVGQAALRCLAAVARSPAEIGTLSSERLGSLLALASSSTSDFVSAEYASLALWRSISLCTYMDAATVRVLIRLCACDNPVVMRHALESLSDCDSARMHLSDADWNKLASLLDFPDKTVRTAAAAVLLKAPVLASGESGSSKLDIGSLAEAIRIAKPSPAPQWELQGGVGNSLQVQGGTIGFSFQSAEEAALFRAAIAFPDRHRLHVAQSGSSRAASGGIAATAATISRLAEEQVLALASYSQEVLAEVARRRHDVTSILMDAAVVGLIGEAERPSGAARFWHSSDHGPSLLSVGPPNVLSYKASFIGGPASATAEGALPHLGEFAYFEVLITASAPGHGVAVGFVDSHTASFQLPGWAENSFGYHGDDGNLHWGGGNHRAYGPTFDVGDVIGCGIDELKGDLFFTLNGAFLGVAATGLNSFKLRPCVGLVSNGQSVFANFGHLPFLWDFTFEHDTGSIKAGPLASAETRYPVAEEAAVAHVSLNNIAGGLWAAKVAQLHDRLSFLEPHVSKALSEMEKILAEK